MLHSFSWSKPEKYEPVVFSTSTSNTVYHFMASKEPIKSNLAGAPGHFSFPVELAAPLELMDTLVTTE